MGGVIVEQLTKSSTLKPASRFTVETPCTRPGITTFGELQQLFPQVTEVRTSEHQVQRFTYEPNEDVQIEPVHDEMLREILGCFGEGESWYPPVDVHLPGLCWYQF